MYVYIRSIYTIFFPAHVLLHHSEMHSVQKQVDLLGHVQGWGMQGGKEMQAQEQQEVPWAQEGEEGLPPEAQVLL